MEISTYRGYKITFEDWRGEFAIENVSGNYEKYKEATAKVDRLIKAESKEGFPMNVITGSMIAGKITSINREEDAAWFTNVKGDREKKRLTQYNYKPNFYQVNEENLALVKRYNEIGASINRLQTEREQLPKQLTEPINFAEIAKRHGAHPGDGFNSKTGEIVVGRE